MKKIIGKILYKLTEFISVLLDAIISIINITVSLVSSVARGLAAIVGAGGCLFLMLMGPFGIALLLNPVTLFLVLFFVIFPILGTKFISWLKYIKYMVTEYLFDYSENLIMGKPNSKTFNDYGRKYRKMEEERLRREQQRRQEEQQKQWEERFKQWYDYQNSQRGNYQGGYYGYGQNAGYGGQTYANPTSDFKSKYERSCDTLGVGYEADKYQIKLSYRKKAKAYHPDINKAPDATKKFQEINEAYEFLSDDNIQRYKSFNS
ncbi:DnaJ domain-containing protein [Tissierella sp. Yu-01]|uniref:DnaJ domain-containing protein n=1 Tax=Tissierella sp. Yu-01 TaxID=3035694 RepID=UPI00240E424A|nr:DnaJ domain-containing protein [Tissierella sp. Yu-01]WFA07980.1 DnaJ domain-containing protein [Tissierella sp. Yu-01]